VRAPAGEDVAVVSQLALGQRLIVPRHGRARTAVIRDERAEPVPAALVSRLAALPRALPASAALIELLGEAVAVVRTPLSTAEPLLAALASAAIWRYVG
jgi:hypothetical protein